VFFAFFIALFLLTWLIVYIAMPASRGVFTVFARAVVRNGHVAQLVERHGQRMRDYWPVAATLLLGAALTGLAGHGFIELAEQVEDKSPALQKVDVQVHNWIVTRRPADATLFFKTMTNIGSPAGVGTICGVAAILLLIRKRYSMAAYLAVTAGGGALADFELKNYFARARPDLAQALLQAQGFSFPSGHAMGSTIVFGALAYLALRLIPNWRWKSATIALALVLIVAIALSRVYLGVHWMSDIIGGISAGAAWLTTTTVAYEVMRRIRQMER
jgi:membrane-associated phospholipid phosphatase